MLSTNYYLSTASKEAAQGSSAPYRADRLWSESTTQFMFRETKKPRKFNPCAVLLLGYQLPRAN